VNADWPVVTVRCESSKYRPWSAWPVTVGVSSSQGKTDYGGSIFGREVGYLSGGAREPESEVWRERNPGKEPMTYLWLRLNPVELARLPGVREAVLATPSEGETP